MTRDSADEGRLERARADFLHLVEQIAEQETTAPSSTGQQVDGVPRFASVAVRDAEVAGPHGAVPVRVYEPRRRPHGTLMWIHGGAFVFGDLEMPEAHWVSQGIAAQGYTVVSVEYRKSLNGVHYPVPADDVRAAWRWTAAHYADPAIPVRRMHLGGASAGAALAAGLVVRLLDGSEPWPASLFLAYPIVHPQLPPLSPELKAAIDGNPQAESFNPHILEGMSYNFAGSLAAFADPHAFAGLADPVGFPPTMVLNSERDILRASGEVFAQQLADAEVPVRCVTEPGAAHGQLDDPTDEIGQRSLGRFIAWLNEQSHVNPARASDQT